MTPLDISVILNHLIDLLERKRLVGEEYINISPSNLQYLFTIKDSGSREAGIEVCSSKTPTASRDTDANKTNLRGESAPRREFTKSRQGVNPGVGSRACRSASSGLNLTMSELQKRVSQCKQCRLSNTRSNTVFGCGSPRARLMCIGDRPNLDDDSTGTPFSGEVGELLDKIIKAMKLSRGDVYLTNIVKCAPPGKQLPQDDEAVTCLPYLQREIELVKPAVIVLFGAVPLKYLLDKKGIAENRGKWFKYNEIDCIPTYHPSYLLRVPKAKRDVWNDMQAVMKRLNIT